jgi:hypothetical protein
MQPDLIAPVTYQELRGQGEPGKSSATPRNKLIIQRITPIPASSEP